MFWVPPLRSALQDKTGGRWVSRLLLLTWGPCGSWSSWKSSLPLPTSARSAPGPDGMPDPKTERMAWHLAAPRRPQWRGRTESSLDLGPREGGETRLQSTAIERQRSMASEVWNMSFNRTYFLSSSLRKEKRPLKFNLRETHILYSTVKCKWDLFDISLQYLSVKCHFLQR